jgi:hypothetical protein
VLTVEEIARESETHRVLACWMSVSSTLSESLNDLPMGDGTISCTLSRDENETFTYFR